MLLAKKRSPLLFLSFDYYLGESDPDIVVLRRQYGWSVAAFSAIGATREGIVEAPPESITPLVCEARRTEAIGRVPCAE